MGASNGIARTLRISGRALTTNQPQPTTDMTEETDTQTPKDCPSAATCGSHSDCLLPGKWGEMTLNETLKLLGYTTAPGRFIHRKAVLKDGVEVFHGYASEVWHWLELSAWQQAHKIEPRYSCEAHRHHSYVEPCPWCKKLPSRYKSKTGVGRRPMPPVLEDENA